MAPAARVSPKARKSPVAKVSTAVTTTPKGLQLSAAQWKAYNAAYSATNRAMYQRIALLAAAKRFRNYRLGAAYATIRKAQAARGAAQAAAIAAYATRRSWIQSSLAKQNVALRSRIEQDMYGHANSAGRLRYIQGGQRAYAHLAVMRTVDTAQSISYEQSVFAAAARITRAAKQSTVKVRTPISRKVRQQIASASNAAGQRAVAALKTSTAQHRGRTSPKPTSARTTGKSARATRTGQTSQRAVANSHVQGQRTRAKSVKAPVKTAKGRTAPMLRKGLGPGTAAITGYWITGGNQELPTCVMTAIANALLDQTGWRLPDEDIAYWTGRTGAGRSGPTIRQALDLLFRYQPWMQVRMAQPFGLKPDFVFMFPHSIIGYETENGPHAAYVRLDGTVVSWGEVVPMPSKIDEAWTCQFAQRKDL